MINMTVVEFFDKVSIDNVISCITMKPEKIIFIGETRPMKQQQEAYRRFTLKQGIEVEFEYKPINKNSIGNIVQMLEAILESESEVVFDLTGGEDLVLVAMGIVYQKYKDEKNIQMHRFSVSSGVITDCDNDGIVPITEQPCLTVEDNIMLYGGAIVPFNGEKGTYRWELDDEFVLDIQVLWGICKKDPRLWNSQLMTLSYMAKQSICEDNPLRIHSSKNYVKSAMEANKQNFVWIKNMMKTFERYGFINGLDDENDIVSFSFKNEQIRQCLTKAGTLLELMVYYYSTSAVDKHGNKRYNDSAIGVYIDWDASLHDISDEESRANSTLILVVVFFLFCLGLKSSFGTFRDANSQIHAKESAHSMRWHTTLKMDYLRNIFRNETVKCAPVFFEPIRFNVFIYRCFNFINNLSCIDFSFLFQKI